MRIVKIFILLFIGFISYSQTICEVCPAGDSLTLVSSFPSTATHQWDCTNGFTSTLQNPRMQVNESCTCYLQVTDTLCISFDTLQVNLCNCESSACLGLAYNESTNTLTFTPTGTINSPIATDVLQYKREQQTTWTNVPVGNALSGCDVKANLNVTATCSYSGGQFNLGYSASICSGTVMTGWQWRGNDGSAITGSSSNLTDWVSRTPAQLNSAGGGGVLDIFARVLNNPNRVIIAKIRFSYTGSGTSCSNITKTVISQGFYNYDFEARRITTYTNGCAPDTCNTSIALPTDQSCQVYGYLARVNFGDGLCPSLPEGGALFMNNVNMTAPRTYQWTYNGDSVGYNPPSYDAGGYCLDGQPFGEYCAIVTDANGCVAQDCYQYQNICATNVSISVSGTTLTATPVSCTGTASYQWRRFQNNSWVNVGTGTTYNTGGLSGQYQVSLTCTGPPSCTAISEYEYINACNVSVGISVGSTTLTASVTGCGGSAITYTWQYWTGSSWSTVQTNTTTSTSNLHSAANSGLYRILVSCNGCSAQNQASITLPDLCASFFVQMTGNFGNVCAGQGNTFNRSVSGGAMPFSTSWFANGNYVSGFSSYTFNPSTPGNYQIQVSVNDNNGCQYTDTRFIQVISCCNMTTSISPSLANVCTGSSQTLTRNVSGGSSPYNTIWTSQLGSNSPVFEGTGSSINLNKSVAGTYSIVATTTDNNGCQHLSFATVTFNSCTNCDCLPTISNTGGCGLAITANGSTCNLYTYSLQYSSNGSGWTSIQSGSSFFSFNYTPSANGFYRIVISRAGCTSASSQTQVTCVSTGCANQPTVSLTSINTTQCGLSPIVISGTRGGSATSVSFSLSGNALGNLSAMSSSASSFSVNYTPNAADVNKTITVTVTTNNPSGAPCVSASATHTINILSNPTPTITSSGGVLCVGSSRNLTATPTGGIWSVVSGNGEIVGSTLTATGTGTIQVQYSLNIGGCSGSTTQNITGVAIPSAPTTSVNCSGGFGNAVITVTAPTGAGFEYKLNNGSWQSSVTFSGVGNGNQTIFVRNSNGCENLSVASVSCGCANSPNIIIPANDQQCGISTKTITGSFSGATEVDLTLSSNAGGTLSTTELTSSPFSFTYTPDASDINKTIIITFTSNNPSGTPCVADIKNYSLAINPLPTAVISGPNAICTGQSVSLIASGGSTYSWSNSLGTGSSKSVSPTSTTTYTVTVTSSQGCQSTTTKTVTVNPLPTVSISTTAANICVGATRTFTGSPSGGTWSNTGQGSFVGNVYSSTTAGSATITYTYTDGNGCTNTASQTITVIALPTTPTLSTDCSLGFGNGRITVTAPTGLEYSLNGSTWQSSTLFSGLSNGNYTVYVRNSTGCISTNTATLNCGCVGGPTISVSPSSGTTCGTNAKSITGSIGGSASTVSGSLSANADGNLTGSNFPFTYTPDISDIGKTIIITFTTNTITGCVEAVGTYTLTVLAPPTASITGPNSFCAGSSIDLVASGGTGYMWSGGGSSATKTVSTAGTYTVTVTSANGCTSTATKTVTSNSLPSVSITAGPSTLCVGQSRSMAGSPVGGVWSLSGVGILTGNQYSAITAGSATITYTYTDGNGCVNTANTTITSVANPSTPAFNVDCSGGSGNGIINVTSPTGAGIEYRLNSGSWQSGTSFSSVANGSYTLSVRNAAGCEASTIVNVNCGCASEPTLTLSAYSGFTCSTNPVTVNGNFGGSATEVFISENGAGSVSPSSSTSSSFSFTYTPAIGDIGNFVTITVVTNNPLGSPCQPVTRTYTLEVRQLPNAIISGNNTICNGQSTTLTASGGTSYSWSTGASTAAITVSPTSNTTYTVTVTGANTCTATATRTVTVNALPTPSISSSSANICVGTTRTLVGSPSGGSWSIISGSGATINGNTLSTSSTGSITIRYTYTNGNGCTNTVDQSISIVAYPSVPTISTTCTANSTSTVTVTAPLGQEYKLNGGSWTPSTSFTGVADGNHIIYVRNASGCESQLSFSTSCGCLVQPTLTLAANSTTCHTTAKTVTGNVFANATNVTATENGDGVLSTSTFGSSPFSFTYTPTANDVGNTVTITFTANIGSPCTPVVRTYQLQVLPLPTAVISGNNVICAGQSTTFTASGGSTYLWSNGSTLASQSLSVAGTYTVTVTASNGCTSTATRSLTVNSLPTPSITSSSANLCTGASRTLTASPSGGTFSVISGTATIIGNVLTTNTAGTVTVQYSYTDGNSCTNTTTQSITFIANPAQPTVNSTCTATNISQVVITPPVSGGPFTYSFNGSSFTSTTTYNNVPNGNHTIVIRNSNNCDNTRIFSTNCGCLTNPSITLSSTSGAVCGTQSITVTGNTFNAATQVTATHNGAGLLTPTVISSNPFSFTYNPWVTDVGKTIQIVFTTNNPDGAPCTPATAIYNLTVRAVPNVVISGNTSICLGESTTLTASGASTYVWSTGATTAAISPSPTVNTTYTVTATASNTCTNTRTVTVNVNPIPTVNITTSTSVLCNNSTRLLTGTPTGGVWEIIEGPVGTYIFNGNVIVPGNASGLVGLRYTVTNQFNCEGVDEIFIPVSVVPTDPVVSQSACSNGLVTATVTSPTGFIFEFQLDGGAWQFSNVFTNVSQGQHTVRVRNEDGCQSQGGFNNTCPTCGCSVTLNQVTNTCSATLSTSCPGYAVQFQRNDGGSWVNIASSGNTVTTENTKQYRAVLTQTGCPNITTNTVTNNFNITPSTTSVNLTNSGNHITNNAWSSFGTYFFNSSTTLPITRSSTATFQKTTGSENAWYCPTTAGCNGFGSRMNQSAVKSQQGSQYYEFTVPSGISGVAIGFSADDEGELCINGTTVFSLIATSPAEAQGNFLYWRVIDRTISAGDVIRIKYRDLYGVQNGAGVEIYSQPVSVLSGLVIDIPVVYRTRNVTNATYFQCPTGTAPDGTLLNCNAIANCKCF